MNAPATRFLQLATVGLDRAPSNRTVVFRGFVDGEDRLVFTTDARSPKVREIERDPRAEACWWFEASREQFRLSGRLEVVGEGAAGWGEPRRQFWASLSPSSRSTFGWPTPGEPLAPPEAFAGPGLDPEVPPPTFALLVLEVEAVDYLNLAESPHRRTVYRRHASGGWVSEPRNP